MKAANWKVELALKRMGVSKNLRKAVHEYRKMYGTCQPEDRWQAWLCKLESQGLGFGKVLKANDRLGDLGFSLGR